MARTIYNTLLFLTAWILLSVGLLMLSVGICSEWMFLTTRASTIVVAIWLLYLSYNAANLLFNRR